MQLWILGLLLLASFFRQASAQSSCSSYSGQNYCDNGYECYYDSDECDGYEDCSDGSDEDGCVDVVGIIIGVTIAGFFLFVILPIIVCVVIFCCVAYTAGSITRRPVTHVVAAAATVPSVVVAREQTDIGYPYAGYPPPYYPQEMEAYPAQYPAYPPPAAYPPSQY